MMEVVIAVAIGVLGGSGVWLVLRPRTFQVIMGLALLAYAVNLFIFSMGSLSIGKEPIIKPGVPPDLLNYTDPMPQALVDKMLALPHPPIVILMTAYGSVDAAVEAMKRGAYDFITKPLNIDRLEILIHRALRSRKVETEVVELKQQVEQTVGRA